MIATALYIVLVLAFFAFLGRGTTPPAERLPWTRWTARDVLGNAALGCRRLVELHERDPLSPHRRTPLHS